MTKVYTGGCACGVVRYQAAALPLLSLHCQYRDCQRMTGTGHASMMVFPAATAAIPLAVVSARAVARSSWPRAAATLGRVLGLALRKGFSRAVGLAGLILALRRSIAQPLSYDKHRICSPLHSHSAIRPAGQGSYRRPAPRGSSRPRGHHYPTTATRSSAAPPETDRCRRSSRRRR
jgi:hypothetical protein